MTGIVVTGHGQYAEGVMSAIRLVAGAPEHTVHGLSLQSLSLEFLLISIVFSPFLDSCPEGSRLCVEPAHVSDTGQYGCQEQDQSHQLKGRPFLLGIQPIHAQGQP